MDKFRTFRFLVPTLVLLLAACLPSVADACPNCKNGLDENYLAIAFGFSVLFMMGMPFSILAAWTLYFVRTDKTAKAKQSSGALEPIQ